MAEQSKEQLKRNLQDSNQWMRILYMFLLAIALYLSAIVTAALIVIQAIFALFTGEDNKNLRALCAGTTQYINQIFLFLTYNDDRKPFPFAEWGEVEVLAVVEVEDESEPSAETSDEVVEAEEALVIEEDTNKPT